MSFRIEKDSLGEFQVPDNAYYGPFTARALEQYHVTGNKSHLNLVKAYVMIKRSAALTNFELQILDEKIAKAIIQACDEILSGRARVQGERLLAAPVPGLFLPRQSPSPQHRVRRERHQHGPSHDDGALQFRRCRPGL